MTDQWSWDKGDWGARMRPDPPAPENDPRIGLAHPLTQEFIKELPSSVRGRVLGALSERQKRIRRGITLETSTDATQSRPATPADERVAYRWVSLGEYAKMERTTPENALIIIKNENTKTAKRGRGISVWTDLPERQRRRAPGTQKKADPKKSTPVAKKPVKASSEVRITNETTGAQKGSKDERFDLIPWEPMQELARLYGFGARKYEAHNWAKGYNWSLSFAALHRHLAQFWLGESTHEVIEGEPETQAHHLASVVFHAFALMYFEKHHPELDDRQLRLFD